MSRTNTTVSVVPWKCLRPAKSRTSRVTVRRRTCTWCSMLSLTGDGQGSRVHPPLFRGLPGSFPVCDGVKTDSRTSKIHTVVGIPCGVRGRTRRTPRPTVDLVRSEKVEGTPSETVESKIYFFFQGRGAEREAGSGTLD